LVSDAGGKDHFELHPSPGMPLPRTHRSLTRLWPVAVVAVVLATPSASVAATGTWTATADMAATHDDLTLTTLNDDYVPV
jgi:hypothetical protein